MNTFVVVGSFGIISEYNYDLLHVSFGITVPWQCLPYKSLGLHLAPHMMHQNQHDQLGEAVLEQLRCRHICVPNKLPRRRGSEDVQLMAQNSTPLILRKRLF